MAMSKKDFIALADEIRLHNTDPVMPKFTIGHLSSLADFCEQQNPRFDRDRWLGYIKGENGPSGEVR